MKSGVVATPPTRRQSYTNINIKSTDGSLAELIDPPSRAALRTARRVLIKAGTSVVAQPNGRPSLTRLGALVEQMGELCARGVQVMFVSSGAVGMGKQVLRRQQQLHTSFQELHHSQHDILGGGGITGTGTGTAMDADQQFSNLLFNEERPHTLKSKKMVYDSACAAAGQFEMMNLYNSLFSQVGLSASQILLTQADFHDSTRLLNLSYAVERLLALGIVPIFNENDAVSANMGYTPDNVFSDNDSLAALCARHFGAEVMMLLTDVDGVFDKSPSLYPTAKLLPLYRPINDNDENSQEQPQQKVEIGAKSAQGRGGMGSKIQAALLAVSSSDDTCKACVVASGADLNSIRGTLGPFDASNPDTFSRGTLFVAPKTALAEQAEKDWIEFYQDDYQQDGNNDSSSSALNAGGSEDEISQETRRVQQMAVAARAQARTLQALPFSVRQSILIAISDALLEQRDVILEANSKDMEQAERDDLANVLKKRLLLTDAKLETLAKGIKSIANGPDPLGEIICKREISEGLILTQQTVPLGVLLIIFESRPDSMPQISALALASGNGLLLKGGKEAQHSNRVLHQVIGDAIAVGSQGQVTRDMVGLVTSRDQVKDLLALDDVIDLVIPRGSNSLVSYIQHNTRIPVLGHADGICHVYVDPSASADQVTRLVVDSKTDYPSACNAMETLLFHIDCISNGVAATALMGLRAAGVQCLGGPRAKKMGLVDVMTEEFKVEYGDLRCTVEVLDSMQEAINWIHSYGSGHTEAIVCQDEAVGKEFLSKVDAACVFMNASTRFADGFRFGLGAEVGISTGRIHARGPVGVKGLRTTQWRLQSTTDVFCASDFSGKEPRRTFTHKELNKNNDNDNEEDAEV